MNIIELTNKIEDIVIKNNLVETASLLKNDYAILKSSELEKSIKEKEDEGRVLTVNPADVIHNPAEIIDKLVALVK